MEKNGENKKKVVDLSPFFLFEAAGDSEDHVDHHNTLMMMMGNANDDDNEEDAQSCSYDVWDVTCTSSHINEPNNDVCMGTHNRTTTVHHYQDEDDQDQDQYSGKLVKDLNEGKHSNKIVAKSRDDHQDYYINNKCTSEVMSTANSNSSSKSCVDSIEGKNMSEKERSKLFWEACLAS